MISLTTTNYLASQDSDDVSFSTRTLTNDNGDYTVIVKKDGFAVVSYIVYIKGLYEYHLKFTTSVDNYNDVMISKIDNVFNSFIIR